MFTAELTKLKRSSLWLIVVVLPVLALITGTVNFQANSEVLSGGWASFTSQVVLFYGIFFFSMGVSVLCAAVWRAEHRGTNWNHLLASTRRTASLVVAKIVVVLLPLAVMQVILFLGTALVGSTVLHLEGSIPWSFAAVCGIAIAAAVPLVAAQSLLSMLLRPFAVAIAICFFGCMFGVATLSGQLQSLAWALPQAIITRAMNLGSSAIADSGALELGDVIPVLSSSLVLTLVLLGISVATIRAIKLR
ncbi:ABC transporter permease [Plantibacter cousiniae (nom. nud.)]|uniref:ABC-2 type transport system permease protein n=1 Tax=Plantibacter cousiniae (nom. nud.) TaxID=199709 RepID=A0ABY1LPM5_9MICO|nr:ABC transporter permease [Plantibacter cousiniae]SKC70753.1 hypothetical protein SAMN06295973_3231 [Plantibacter cousiniae]